MISKQRTATLDAKAMKLAWETTDWKKVEAFINKIQTRIAKATKQGETGLVRELRRMLTHSYYAKLWAVRKVTTNQGKRTAGIDGIKWTTASEKCKAVLELNKQGYQPKPLKRVYINKANGKKRGLGIPIMKDRAMQTLEALPLDPVIEMTSDISSFGFRKNRSCHDAMEKLYINLSKKTSPEWILEGDIRACFDEISHEWLLANTPMDKKMLKGFLKAGFVYKKKLFPTINGTPQGGLSKALDKPPYHK